ncbi:MAG: autorepressor SdpR family transcription factor [Actinomycetota bacterium]
MDGSYKALADPTRRRILEMLRDGDLTAGDIAGEFDMAWASVSHHLNVLKNADLVLSERDGQNIRYSLNTTVLQELVANLMELGGKKRRKTRDA